ncbi:MAG: hypothetical protein CM15mP54_19960 [Paracoccaceae bacterium]|nr:MAG: hypothetical protein CM15mP54_19960 [Paracoccaceae bacterium]
MRQNLVWTSHIFELWAHKIAVVRSILVGFFCGILPGIGATLAAFMGYGEAVRWSKNKSDFGKGKLEELFLQRRQIMQQLVQQ